MSEQNFKVNKYFSLAIDKAELRPHRHHYQCSFSDLPATLVCLCPHIWHWLQCGNYPEKKNQQSQYALWTKLARTSFACVLQEIIFETVGAVRQRKAGLGDPRPGHAVAPLPNSIYQSTGEVDDSVKLFKKAAISLRGCRRGVRGHS